jgi:molybdate transport system substrate-binding protein
MRTRTIGQGLCGTFAGIAVALGLVILPGTAAQTAEIRVIALASMTDVLRELGPQFERASGHKLVIQYGVAGEVRKQIESGAPFDLAIVTAELMSDLAKQGRFASGTQVRIARVGVGVAVRAGAPKPD